MARSDRIHRWLLCGLGGWLLLLLACRAPTQITLELTTDVSCTDPEPHTTISVDRLIALESAGTAAEKRGCVDRRIGSLVVLPGDSTEDDVAIRVVTGIDKSAEACVSDGYLGGCIVARRSLSFLDHTPLYLPIEMRAVCIDRPCEADETCYNGECVSAEIDPNTCTKPEGCQPTGEGEGGGGGAGGGGGEGGGPDFGGIATGSFNTCAWRDGAARCWGTDPYHGHPGQDAIGDDETPASAGDVSLGGAVVEVSVGDTHACARFDDGGVRCWGYNGSGQLGYMDGETIGDDELPSSVEPVALGGPATQVVCGQNHTCALLADGSVRCWGQGFYGQLGYGNTDDIGDDEPIATQAPVNLGGTVTQLATAWNHTCAVLDTGAVRCWGLGSYGQLGYGDIDNIGDGEEPEEDVVLLGPAKQVATGTGHTCALLVDGRVQCWGGAGNGELGYGEGEMLRYSPGGPVDVGGAVSQIVTRGVHTCVVVEDGSVRCWGISPDGRLGYGNTITVGLDDVPASVGSVAIGGTVLKIAAGLSHTCALLGSGDTGCWGDAGSGKLGYPNTSNIGDGETPASVGYVSVW